MSENNDEMALDSIPENDCTGIEIYTPQRGRPKESIVSAEVEEGIYSYVDEEGTHFEPPRVLRAFKRYIHMGRGRTLEGLAQEIMESNDPDWKNAHSLQSIQRMLGTYSANFNWQERLRKHQAEVSAKALASAQREALSHTKERIKLAARAQKFGMLIIEKAKLETLSVKEARGLLKDGTQLLKLGIVEERAEAGDVLMTIKPDKPIREMSDEELDQYTDQLMRALQ